MVHTTPLIDGWPKISFKVLEDVEVEGQGLRLFYQSFFKVMHLPETLMEFLKQDPK